MISFSLFPVNCFTWGTRIDSAVCQTFSLKAAELQKKFTRTFSLRMDKYEELETLGRGGSGRAILARRQSDDHRVVLKEVRLTLLKSKDRECAIRESSILSSLRHPYIVDYIESFQERGCLYIVMGYAEGGDLASRIRSRTSPFSEAEVLHYFIELALALRYVHGRKILHRDLKCENVFLTGDGTVKLGDFGIAKGLETTFQCCTTKLGTPFYLPPEICQGRSYNTKVDVWGLGCVLYELCTGTRPFDGLGLEGLMRAIIAGRVAPIDGDYSPDLKSLVDKMLTKDPVKRPSINQILDIPFIRQRLSAFGEAPRKRLLTAKPERLLRPQRDAKPDRMSQKQRGNAIDMDILIAEAEREQQQSTDKPDCSAQWEQRERIKRMNLSEVKAFMRSQKHKTNSDMDELIAQAEREQSHDLSESVMEFASQKQLLDNNVSICYQAETIRAFLERAIGVDKLTELGQGDAREALRGYDPNVVELAEQLIELDQKIEVM
jgi:NIMA (never in mitosis gene a)-related kinase